MAKPHMCDTAVLRQDISGKRFIVTGANSGIGFVTTQQLAKQGAEVILACRNVGQGEAKASDIRASNRDAKLEVRALDLGSLASVRAFAKGILADYDAMHGLINNAGVMNTDRGTTADGFETQIGINHLGHFALTNLLLDLLKQSAPARVVNVSSCFHDKAMGREGRIDLDDLNFERRDYDGWTSYAQSKLANLLHARELARRLEGTGVTAVSVHPGWVRTNLARNTMPVWVQNTLARPLLRLMGMIEPWEGAQTSLHAALAPTVEQHNGAYFSQVGLYRNRAANKGGWPMRSPNPHANDDALAKKLWELSDRLVSEKPSAEASVVA